MTGRPLAIPAEHREMMLGRVMSRAAADGDCLLWRGYTRGRVGNQYGVLYIAGVVLGARRGRYEGAHRVSYALAHGPIASGEHVLHRCDNGLCVQAEHLFIGNPSANMADMWQKERHAAPRTRLTAEQLARVAGHEDARALASEFGMHWGYIYKLRKRLRGNA